METTVRRQDITNKDYREILDKETHDHEIVKRDGVIRWKKNEKVDALVDKIGLNDLIMLLHCLGYGKNSEIYRQLYRDMGYSLSGYWEIFYWEVNNPDAEKYKNECLQWVEEKVKATCELSEDEYNKNISVKQTDGWYWIGMKQMYSTTEIEKTFPLLEEEYEVKLKWSTSTWSLGIKRLQKSL